MIKVYSDYNKATDLVLGVDALFNVLISGKEINNEFCISMLQRIDDATLVDVSLGTITTPFGTTSIKHLSTGCKTAILCFYYINKNESKCINVSECGGNALEEIFDLVNDSCVSVMLRHTSFVIDREFSYLLNDSVECKDAIELKRRLRDVL